MTIGGEPLGPAWKRIPFLRDSFWRLVVGMPRMLKTWQVGDGREARLLEYVQAQVQQGDAESVLRAIDEYSYNHSYLINIGDEKGRLLDAALQSAAAGRVLELGTYCGYSALRMALAAPTAHIYSVDLSGDNIAIATQLWAHAGVTARVTPLEGTLGDGGRTLGALRAQGFGPGSVDLVLLDHDHDHYVPDLQRILAQQWLRPGGMVVADNVGFPGAPAYRAYMQSEEGKLFRTVEHRTCVEYQSVIRDLVLVSELLPTGSAPSERPPSAP